MFNTNDVKIRTRHYLQKLKIAQKVAMIKGRGLLSTLAIFTPTFFLSFFRA